VTTNLRSERPETSSQRLQADGWLDGGHPTRYSRHMPATAQPTDDLGPHPRSWPPLWVLIFAAWLIPAVLSGFDTYMQARLEGRPPEWRWVFFNSIDWLLYAGLTPIVFRASRHLPLVRPKLARNIALHAADALAMCAAWAGLGMLLRLAIFPTPDGSTL
jgi:hypothetical protein